MDFKVFLHPKADAFLQKAGDVLGGRITEKIRLLSTNPEEKGERIHPSDYYRLRVGDYRVIYEVWREEGKVVVLFIGHRSKVYDDFSKLL